LQLRCDRSIRLFAVVEAWTSAAVNPIDVNRVVFKRVVLKSAILVQQPGVFARSHNRQAARPLLPPDASASERFDGWHLIDAAGWK
jgi:hypothetical protein